MDVEKRHAVREEGQGPGPSSVFCSICLEPVSADLGDRSVAKLQCGHEFHLDCIGSAFNAKGIMQCPNCRKVEKGQWLYANGYHSVPELNVNDLVNEDLYNLNYSEMPFGFHWCPVRGFTQLASLFDDSPPPLSHRKNVNHDPLRSTSFGDSTSHVCPYLALHGHHAPSNPADPLPDTGSFHRHLADLAGQPPGAMMSAHTQGFAEPQHHSWQPHPSASLPLPGSGDQAAAHMGLRLVPGTQEANRGRAPLAILIPSTMGMLCFFIHLSPPSSSPSRGRAFLPVRTWPRRVAFVSTMAAAAAAAASSSVEAGGLYRLSLPGAATGQRHQEGEGTGRHFDHLYGVGRDGFSTIPWIPVDGEPQWWGPFHHGVPNPPPGIRRRAVADSPDGGYLPPPIPLLRMPPFV
ncbi:unnamed protein product [Spirodela intermedia]|uniref:RING-type domain-containing protein n=1 Tax=Spirodela intermedia TaxID=51605 RepID=A0A7I8JDA7_SPIIN|nr:unnamed protein product [Spirodela intermedia]CAA6668130.1 unnamed protein product [Spirodela intermedia]